MTTKSKSLLVQGYEVVIGFETHAQLSTQSKNFQPRTYGIWRRAQHASLRCRLGLARHVACHEQRGG